MRKNYCEIHGDSFWCGIRDEWKNANRCMFWEKGERFRPYTGMEATVLVEFICKHTGGRRTLAHGYCYSKEAREHAKSGYEEKEIIRGRTKIGRCRQRVKRENRGVRW